MQGLPAQVVPPAVDADLDVVAGELVVGAAEPGQLVVVGDAAAVRLLQLLAVDVGDDPHPAGAANRAVVLELGAEVGRGPEQLGVGVADVEPGERTLLEVAQDRPASEGVVRDGTHGRSVGAAGAPRPPPAPVSPVPLMRVPFSWYARVTRRVAGAQTPPNPVRVIAFGSIATVSASNQNAWSSVARSWSEMSPRVSRISCHSRSLAAVASAATMVGDPLLHEVRGRSAARSPRCAATIAAHPESAGASGASAIQNHAGSSSMSVPGRASTCVDVAATSNSDASSGRDVGQAAAVAQRQADFDVEAGDGCDRGVDPGPERGGAPHADGIVDEVDVDVLDHEREVELALVHLARDGPRADLDDELLDVAGGVGRDVRRSGMGAVRTAVRVCSCCLGPRSGTRRRRPRPSAKAYPLKNVSVERRSGVTDWTGAGSRSGSWRGIGMGLAGW